MTIRDNIKTPLLAVDCIIEYGNKIILIKRENEPKGLALPGGFVDIGESTEDAIKREITEETNLELTDIELFNVYSKPNRDPRDHIVSVTYIAKAKGELKVGDDAKKVILKDINEIETSELVFDHNKILHDYKNYINENQYY